MTIDTSIMRLLTR